MQTFLPYWHYSASARVLDRKRLGKQRVEVLQILRSLSGASAGWANHPATKMWRGYERSLAAYGLVVCREWRRRGYKDTCTAKISALGRQFARTRRPPWLGDASFHSAHRAALLWKNSQHYRQFGWAETPGLHYIWPG